MLSRRRLVLRRRKCDDVVFVCFVWSSLVFIVCCLISAGCWNALILGLNVIRRIDCSLSISRTTVRCLFNWLEIFGLRTHIRTYIPFYCRFVFVVRLHGSFNLNAFHFIGLKSAKRKKNKKQISMRKDVFSLKLEK